MPISTPEGKDWTREKYRALTPSPRMVLDIGAGIGTYIDLLHDEDEYTEWHAAEIWEPYIEEYHLIDKYDQVFNVDIRDFPFGPYDVVFLGDVLEHMPKADAVLLLRYAKSRARNICVSVPIIYAPQGCVNGNEFETHHHHWEFGEMLAEMMDSTFPAPVGVVDSFKGEIVGVYWWSRSSSD